MTEINHVYIATNNGEIGGGEVMLLELAAALESLGHGVSVVGPAVPRGVLEAAVERGLPVVELPSSSRVGYMRALREWRRKNSDGLLWCNGLVPATATAGLRDRIVHLHQLPSAPHRLLVVAARARARITLVPSEMLSRRIPKTRVLHNWSPALERVAVPGAGAPIRLGFLGRPCEAKGFHVLAEAFEMLRRAQPRGFHLRVAGEPRFVDARERAFVDSTMRMLGPDAERLGWMPADEFFGTIDILVVPSVWDETFGLVVTEAMSARVPVVVTDAGALPEVVGPDHPWIAKAGDSGDLARVIGEAVRSLPAEDVVGRAHQRWSEQFTREAGRDRVRDLLDDLGLVVRGAL